MCEVPKGWSCIIIHLTRIFPSFCRRRFGVPERNQTQRVWTQKKVTMSRPESAASSQVSSDQARGTEHDRESWTVSKHDDEDTTSNRFPRDESEFMIEDERFDLGEDVYSLIFVSPICSASFWFSMYMIILKMLLFTFLALDLHDRSNGRFDQKNFLIRCTQFFLLPVAVALQEDLIHVYTRIANIRYDPEIQQKSPMTDQPHFPWRSHLLGCPFSVFGSS